ncbi:hypothetical protein Q5O14_07750 [Eubacteriaceae bacterium ES2]|nr:hypothetical protein Q5O14_07750 [Eubacteriaceae bacterium ES2]
MTDKKTMQQEVEELAEMMVNLTDENRMMVLGIVKGMVLIQEMGKLNPEPEGTDRHDLRKAS